MRVGLLLSISLIALMACGEAQNGGDAVSSSSSSTPTELRSTSDVTYPGGYEAWKAGFRARSLSRGISASIFDRAFAGTGVNSTVLRLDRNQAEFTKTLTEYLDSAVNSRTISIGRTKNSELSGILDRIEAQTGVDRGVVLAVWGRESGFGNNFGNIPIAEALGTLAYDGRRRSWAEEQLLAALRIMQNGDVAPERMVGSWAGALGHTQFIPTSYMSYAIDGNGDGKRDLWNVTDALFSTANYLKRNGWQQGVPWGMEVNLPVGFSLASIGEKTRQPASVWNSRGVTLANGGQIPNYGESSIIAPSGSSGPKFVVFKNFRVIKTYNNSSFYAIAVGHLGDRIKGGEALRNAGPWDPNLLKADEMFALQTALNRKGYSIEKIDGIYGDQTEAAIRAYQAANGLTVDGLASRALYERLT